MLTELQTNLEAILNEKNTKIIPANIKSGITIFNVTGTAVESNEEPSKNVTITEQNQEIEPSSNYTGMSKIIATVSSAIDSNIQAANIRENISILGVTGTAKIIPDGVFVQTSTPTKDTDEAIWLQESTVASTSFINNIPNEVLQWTSSANKTVTEFILALDSSIQTNIDNYNKHLLFINGDTIYLVASDTLYYDPSNNATVTFDNTEKVFITYTSSGIVDYTSDTSVSTTQMLSANNKYADKNIYDTTGTTITVKAYVDTTNYLGVTIDDKKYEVQINKGNQFNKILDTSDGNITATDVRTGKVGYSNNQKITGTMPDNGALTITPSTTAQTIPAGYTSGGIVSAVTSDIDSNIQSKNIKSGITILGISGNSNVIDTTTESVIPNYTSVTNFELDSETNYYIFSGSLKNGILKIEFTNNLVQNIVLNYKGSGFAGDGILSFQMDNENPIDITEDKSIYTDYVFSNVLPGSHTITIDVPNMIGTTYLEIKMIPIIESGITSNTVLNGNIGFVNGTKVIGTFAGVDSSDATATSVDICAGKTAYINNVKVTGTGAMTFATVTEMNQVTTVPEDTLAIVYGDTYVGTYRFDNGSWTEIGSASTGQSMMNNLNALTGDTDQYEGLGGTEEEINEVFDDILGNEEE